MFRRKNEYDILNQMLEDAMDGTFQEDVYDESELSKLQVRWKRYLSAASLSEQERNREKQSLKELITNISHQTRTPLTNILLYAQLLGEQELEESSREYADQILSHAQKLELLIQSLVRMSRLETGMFQYHVEKQTLEILIRSTVESVQAKAAQKKIEVQVCVPEKGFPAACFDRKWTAEAVENILDNAVKYSPPQTTVTVRPFARELFAGLTVTDQGAGIAEEEIPRIFSRFYRGEAGKDKEGIGVGLFLTRQITEGQGGYLRVISEKGKGSSFSIFLPAGESFQTERF